MLGKMGNFSINIKGDDNEYRERIIYDIERLFRNDYEIKVNKKDNEVIIELTGYNYVDIHCDYCAWQGTFDQLIDGCCPHCTLYSHLHNDEQDERDNRGWITLKW